MISDTNIVVYDETELTIACTSPHSVCKSNKYIGTVQCSKNRRLCLFYLNELRKSLSLLFASLDGITLQYLDVLV